MLLKKIRITKIETDLTHQPNNYSLVSDSGILQTYLKEHFNNKLEWNDKINLVAIYSS
ncbi:hypothetical protein C1645_828474 [Glomus cerebriforme]|uniref:Uncharacterized protein n=1 Tax=Glomus cerebriforme TaxID=658196 RepID=A0A397SL81_9GLOM|nr:hypothetical protein C1645_828474 [Glomus cerebriforme]